MQKETLNKKIVITGGGSGGHVSVSSALISELEKRYSNLTDKLSYIGGDLAMIGDYNQKSIEQIRFEKSKYNFYKIRAGKLQRTFSPKSISLFFRTFLGFIDSFKYLNQISPDLIISTGGFVSLPVVIAGYIKKIPIYIHEQTAAVGLTNKIAGYFSQKVFLTFKDSEKFFRKDKTYVVGNPIRDCIFQINTDTPTLKKLENMKLNKSFPIIYISGGSLGSHIINTAVRDCLPYLLDKYQVILQTGDNQTFKDFDVLTKDILKLPQEKQNRIILTKFVSDQEIGNIFSSSTIFIGRSGANTVYELGVLRKPCILIPIPWVTHNEQEKNAKVLEKLGLATIVREGEISRENFLNQIEKKFNNLNNQIQVPKDIFPTDASQKIIDGIFDN